MKPFFYIGQDGIQEQRDGDSHNNRRQQLERILHHPRNRIRFADDLPEDEQDQADHAQLPNQLTV